MPFVKNDPRLIGNRNGVLFYKGQFDDLQPNWKGDSVSYAGLHKWLFRRKGKAGPLCVKCGLKKRCQWASIDGKYPRDLSHYLSMCSACHKLHDYALRFGNKCQKGHDFTPENTSIVRRRNGFTFRRCKQCINAYARQYNKSKKNLDLHNNRTVSNPIDSQVCSNSV